MVNGERSKKIALEMDVCCHSFYSLVGCNGMYSEIRNNIGDTVQCTPSCIRHDSTLIQWSRVECRRSVYSTSHTARHMAHYTLFSVH